jgi:hypothetical protein
MQHDKADGDAARARAAREYTATWHPMLSAAEIEPGHWQLVTQYAKPYGDIRLVKRGTELGYRGDDVHGELVGYFRTFRAACHAVHMDFVRSHGAPEFQGYPG